MFPVFEPVQDDVSHFNEPTAPLIEEFLRQQLPQFVTRRLQTKIFNLDLNDEIGPPDKQASHSRIVRFSNTKIR
jgi:hypothetical protein